jgi:hypothetical protein
MAEDGVTAAALLDPFGEGTEMLVKAAAPRGHAPGNTPLAAGEPARSPFFCGDFLHHLNLEIALASAVNSARRSETWSEILHPVGDETISVLGSLLLHRSIATRYWGWRIVALCYAADVALAAGGRLGQDHERSFSGFEDGLRDRTGPLDERPRKRNVMTEHKTGTREEWLAARVA